MNTTGIVLSLTDEQLKDIDEYCEMTQHIESGEQACVSLYELRGLLEELRRLRAENAELERVVKDVRWRVADTTDQLQAYSYNGDRLYGLDEWSVPIRNLNIAIGMLEKATQ